MPATFTKRQNFDVTPEQEAEIRLLQNTFGVGSAKEAILKAVHLTLVLAREVKEGKRICLVDRRQGGNVTELLVPELEAVGASPWEYLVARPHAWKKQLYIKGRKLTAAQVWLDMRANDMSELEAAENWDLPIQSIAEVAAYCEQNRDLLRAEAEEEKLHLQTQGVKINR